MWLKVEESGVFYGEYIHTLDKKNRVIIPSRFREPISDEGVEKLFITRGLDKCLFVFPEMEWRKQEDKFNAMPFTKKQNREFKRMFFSGAVENVPDGQWRILVPEYLKEYAGLEKEMMIIGVGNRMEIWDKKKWENYYSNSKDNYERIAEDLMDL
jgi:MraZ protein